MKKNNVSSIDVMVETDSGMSLTLRLTLNV